ncbi:nuclear transport factor 2 family protein [Spirosoma sp. KNUC1025]|uniref:nuclear transport factor 2 family protein n=1 Tax=Spirosoma sp. KNUC1025 TaxID=2894082 RepID=UPI001E5E4ADB|nr:nuclear transport factor 2 family protein [Spirosoma sp. KNUC1025]UFH57894.1 nuclear transport factor 2 family protein [Spirosoma sp. KNUC1025]
MDYHAFADEWIASWNAHDLTAILAHYADDIEIFTPMIKLAAGGNQESLVGKEAVGAYWQKALNNIPDLHFKLLEVTTGINSVALYYESVMNKKAIEVMFFNDQGKVSRMYAHYT